MNENKNTQVQETATEQQNSQTMEVTDVAITGQYAITESTAKPVYCTVDTSTAKGKKALYNMKNHPDHNIADFINKTIDVVGVYIDVNQRLIKEGENAGCYEEKPRTILIDKNGKTYISGVSVGIYQSVKEILRIFGDPREWGEPLTVQVVQIATPKGNMLSLELV